MSEANPETLSLTLWNPELIKSPSDLHEYAIWLQDSINDRELSLEDRQTALNAALEQLNNIAGNMLGDELVECSGLFIIPRADQATLAITGYATDDGHVRGRFVGFQGRIESFSDEGNELLQLDRIEIGYSLECAVIKQEGWLGRMTGEYWAFVPVSTATVEAATARNQRHLQEALSQIDADDPNLQAIDDCLFDVDELDFIGLDAVFDQAVSEGFDESKLGAYLKYVEATIGVNHVEASVLCDYFYIPDGNNVGLAEADGIIVGICRGFTLSDFSFEPSQDGELDIVHKRQLCMVLEAEDADEDVICLIPAKNITSYELNEA